MAPGNGKSDRMQVPQQVVDGTPTQKCHASVQAVMQTCEQLTHFTADLDSIRRRRELHERPVEIQEQAAAAQQIDWWFAQIAHARLLQKLACIATRAGALVVQHGEREARAGRRPYRSRGGPYR